MPDLTKYNSLIAYLIAKLRSTTAYSAFDRALKYTRRFLWISRIIRYIGIAATVIETSAVLVVTAALFIVLIPLLALTSAVFLSADIIIGTRLIKSPKLDEYLSRKEIIIFSHAGSFGSGYAKELAEEGSAVFVVEADLSGKFICMKKENGVYYVRHAFFFRLKRKRLNKLKHKLTYLL